ncbi:MAG TPA: MFS transporter [Fimbriimonas sp.]|nr:MFS transporter [Fimbriimonas sp.]
MALEGNPAQESSRKTFLDMNGYQWTVLFAAWLGWGFDVFDGLLFNYVAPSCVPSLLGLKIGSPDAKQATLFWTGVLTSLLLIGWGAGGILFGRICDRIGRSKTLLLTMSLYALGTALCAITPNIWLMIVFRFIASLGIGGEWAAGASMVAEVVPEKRRVEAGALLYTSASAGLFLATFLTYQIQGVFFKANPEVAWRYVFACGLIPAAFAFVVRSFVREPQRWQQIETKKPSVLELFSPELRKITFSGFSMALVALIGWWSCNAFIAVVATSLAQTSATAQHLAKADTQALVESWKALAVNAFTWGGLIGTLLTIPAAKYIGRKAMYFMYYLLSGVALFAAFGIDMDPHTRLYMYFPIGLTVFGVFGSFTYYLPELFPTRLRATGAGTCYNSGRFIAAIGPFIVGMIAKKPGESLHAMFWIGVVPLIGLLLLPWVIETKGRALAD